MNDIFERELKALLEKHNISIVLESDDGSDWHGVSGEKFISRNNATGESHVLVENTLCLSSSDLTGDIIIPDKAEKAWALLGEIPVNDEDEIETAFLHFPALTDKFDIWNWFEAYYDVSTLDLASGDIGAKL